MENKLVLFLNRWQQPFCVFGSGISVFRSLLLFTKQSLDLHVIWLFLFQQVNNFKYIIVKSRIVTGLHFALVENQDRSLKLVCFPFSVAHAKK